VADLKKLALGRKGFARMDKAKPEGKAKKPDKSLEKSCRDEIGEVEAAFRNRLAKEDKRKVAATDSENWFCVYFQTREAKERFLRDHGLDRIGDKYLDGRAMDRVLKGRSSYCVRKDSHWGHNRCDPSPFGGNKDRR
jgi:hypothetical protein